MNEYRVPFSRPSIGDEEIEAVAEVLRSGWLTTGKQASLFESEFAKYIGCKHALAVSSCTAGLHLALSAMNIGPGDEVITTPLTFCATVQAIEETGARVVFCDVGADLNMDPSHLPRLLSPRTRAIVPVHMAGLPCAMDEIWNFACRHKLFVIEDAAHAIGSSYSDKAIGAGMSNATVFSFFANKNMTTGEGGMIASSDSALLDRMRYMSRHGIRRTGNSLEEPLPWSYEVIERGLKCNLSDLQAAIGRVQLKKLDSMLSRRSNIAAAYHEAFRDCDAVELPRERPGTQHAWHLFILRLNLSCLSIDREQFTRKMSQQGVECSVHFIPIPMHPYYRQRFPYQAGYAEALHQFPRLLSLPIYPGMSASQISIVTAAILEIVHNCRSSRAQYCLHEAGV